MSILLILSIICVAVVVLAAYSIFHALPSTAIDVARNTLFELRDELFEMGRSGQLGFDSKVYNIHRNMLNGMIRFAHDVSLINFLISQFAFRKVDKELSNSVRQQMVESMKNLDEETRAKLERIYTSAMTAIVRLVLTRSILAVGVLSVVVMAALVKRLSELVFDASKNVALKVAGPVEKEQEQVNKAISEVLQEKGMSGVTRHINAEASRHIFPDEGFGSAGQLLCAA